MSEATPVLCQVRRKLKKKMTDCPKDQFLREKYKIINRAYQKKGDYERMKL